MTRRHRLIPSFVLALAAAAVIAPTAQARPIVSGTAGGSGTGAVLVERTVHDQPLANPVHVRAIGLNHGAGITDRTRPITIASSSGTDWADVLLGALAGVLVLAVCAAGIGTNRRANPAT
jgi:hypothetical protein